MGSKIKLSEEEEMSAINQELKQIETEIVRLHERKNCLVKRKTDLKDAINKRKSEKLASKDWSANQYPWSDKVKQTLLEKFSIKEFRNLQLETINATLSKQDIILIMPTGGGKSLCYQLPALIDSGITVVVSPLVSLMEDQVMGLKKLGIPTVMMSANSNKEETKEALDTLRDKNSTIKLIYVTPEKLAKSKTFMSLLQKCAEQGRFSRLAIDEVHCCSTWGHDFRPDYKFLGVFKAMFPETPILGLTATSTSKVTLDVQKMLSIEGCLILRDTFNRPNLYYKVQPKPPNQQECMELIKDLVNNKYKNKSGIIYTTTIKECEELVKELRKNDIRAGIYHAMLESSVRSKMHMKWMTGDYQVIVGTIAFGLGIDKPDVRFIIHYCLSKSMESYYQESGRAGRDGQPAHCILLYRLSDVFKLSTMVFTQQTGLECLYNMVKYCLDVNTCRRSMIAQHFDEVWTRDQCEKMCDHCCYPRAVKTLEVVQYCRDIYKLLQKAASQDCKLTLQKLIDVWYNKGEAKLRHPEVTTPAVSRVVAESVVAFLIIEEFLKEDFHFTPYSTLTYIKRGFKANLVNSSIFTIQMNLAGAKVDQNTSTNSSDLDKKIDKPKSLKRKLIEIE